MDKEEEGLQELSSLAETRVGLKTSRTKIWLLRRDDKTFPKFFKVAGKEVCFTAALRNYIKACSLQGS